MYIIYTNRMECILLLVEQVLYVKKAEHRQVLQQSINMNILIVGIFFDLHKNNEQICTTKICSKTNLAFPF
ncbi:unnamed protein product [Paramecium sonneborni]|uniref:Uncharacterized protein n=1 Tax=Paramecium sonneborni TaxID=65129 RepID=A0A8S1RVM0_9CILI|nr:unnamed protein product [Paramecium sonneborni]